MDLYNGNGAVLIKKGTEMNKALRSRLLRNNIDCFITDIAIFKPDVTKLLDADDIILREVEELQEVYQESFDEFSNQMEKLKISGTIDKAMINEIANDLIGCITEHKQVYMGIQGIRKKDFYTYIHSIDVAIFAIIMGETLGFSKEDLKKLVLSALLHDVGKIEIDDKILSKPSSLTKEEMDKMKMHTTYGYELIKHKLGYREDVAIASRQHHERIDGGGYPYGLRKEKIHYYSQIIAICDIYDAITADRVYRKAVLPHRGVEYLMSVTNSQIDYDLTRRFIQNIAIYPLGTPVALNNGEEGVVVHLHNGFPQRPIVKIRNSSINRDLMRERTLFVKEVIDES